MDPELIQEFVERGVVVVPSVLSEDELQSVREGLHAYLNKNGCDVDNLSETAGALAALSSTGGAGGILDIFWADFKLKVLEHPGVCSAVSSLWDATFASAAEEHFTHDYGPFDPHAPIAAADRVCFRLPDSLMEPSSSSGEKSTSGSKKPLQRHLAPHLDCCPHETLGPGNKWRPVQGFVALTDCLLPEQGGFECCPGMHREFSSWASTRTWTGALDAGSASSTPPPCQGPFTPLRPKEDADVLARFESIPCRAGDLVLWDNRLPHANSRRHIGREPREVVYVGLLPPVARNVAYAADQLQRFREGRLPSDFWIGKKKTALQRCNYEFSSLGRSLMRMDDA